MSGLVQILDDTVANQIAAGEVVERPVSVVKELVENSLDAGAEEITVVVSDGGRSLIQVIDDGAGMGRVDAELSVQRFATSKIRLASELERIGTFGFRGEALPSIASVSRFSLLTSNGHDGSKIEIVGGRKESSTPITAKRGTTVSIRDLFFNTPARRSFLRSERSELALIRALLADFAVAAPRVRFTLVSDGTQAMTIPASNEAVDFIGFSSRAKELKLVSTNDPLECSGELDTAGGVYRAYAVLTKPLDCVSGAGKLRLLVNGRSVRDRILLRAIRDAYGNFLRADRYPAGVLHLIVPPPEVDVNVHPQKAEVRYRFPERVFAVVRQAVGVTLRAEQTSSVGVFPMPSFESGLDSVFERPAFATPLFDSLPQSDANELPLNDYRFVGQIFGCYLLMEDPKGGRFAIVDMHAAHERVTFAQLKRAWVEGEIRTQQLLIPDSVFMGIRSDSKEILSLLEGVGFEVEGLGEDSVVIRGVPAILSRFSAKRVVEDLFSQLSSADLEGALERKIDAVISRLACHGSVRSGRELEREEVYQLLKDLESTELRAFCPHGRSVSRVLTTNEIERLFGRVQ